MHWTKWDTSHVESPQTAHPRSCPGTNITDPGTNKIGPGTSTIDPGSPYRKIPIRLNVYEKLLSLIGLDQG